MTSTAMTIVPGSLQDVADQSGQSLAESFMSCDLLVLIDQSGSMGMADAYGGQSRYDAAEAELQRLQATNPGRIGVVAFSTYPVFCPGGAPIRLGETTDMAAALRMVLPADGVVDIVLISDGQPDSESETLEVARRFTSKIHTIFVGDPDDWRGGRLFLEQLAAATGGLSSTPDEIGRLAEPVTRLLAGGVS